MRNSIIASAFALTGLLVLSTACKRVIPETAEVLESFAVTLNTEQAVRDAAGCLAATKDSKGRRGLLGDGVKDWPEGA